MKQILLIATGGTIASQPTENGLAPQLLAEDILRCVPALGSLCRIDAVQQMVNSMDILGGASAQDVG